MEMFFCVEKSLEKCFENNFSFIGFVVKIGNIFLYVLCL